MVDKLVWVFVVYGDGIMLFVIFCYEYLYWFVVFGFCGFFVLCVFFFFVDYVNECVVIEFVQLFDVFDVYMEKVCKLDVLGEEDVFDGVFLSMVDCFMSMKFMFVMNLKFVLVLSK